jgi:hypothetical protein
VTIADGRGSKIDQGTLLRYLGESVWFPSAALASYIRWEPIDDSSATATISYAGVSASGVFTFDDQGRFLRMTARRYKDGAESASPETWEVRASAWGSMSGVSLPVEGAVTWKLRTGDFECYRWKIAAIHYNEAVRRATTGAGEAPVVRPPARAPGAAVVIRP